MSFQDNNEMQNLFSGSFPPGMMNAGHSLPRDQQDDLNPNNYLQDINNDKSNRHVSKKQHLSPDKGL